MDMVSVLNLGDRNYNFELPCDVEIIDMEEENLRLQLEVTRQRLLLNDSEEQFWDEKKIVQQLRNDKIQHETCLAFPDAVILELEANLEENSKKYVAQQENIKDLEVLIVKFD
jgi:hypothetical protein